MLDHVFTDSIASLRDALEDAHLERQAVEERLSSDLLLGDVIWETSYSLPGEGTPPSCQADITLSWPTWAQSAYRTWYLDGKFGDPPTIDIDVVLRLQALAMAAEPEAVLRGISKPLPSLGSNHLEVDAITLETGFSDELKPTGSAVEVSLSGRYELGIETLEDGSVLDKTFNSLGGWIAATLVQLGDLPLDFLEASQ